MDTRQSAAPLPPRRHARPLALVAAIAVAALIPAGAVAASGFGDVAAGHPHEGGIDFVADVGVTAGCGDGSDYCPNDDVTRAQMATFMHRLSGNAPGVAPSVDAATVQGMSPADLQGQQGPEGPQGPQGPAGPQGEPGASPLANIESFEYVNRISNEGPAGNVETRSVGTFQKLEDDTVLRITSNPYLHAGSSDVGSCSSWVTVDGKTAFGEETRDGFEVYARSSDQGSRTYVGYFEDVDAGSVEIGTALGHHGSGHTCYEGHVQTNFTHRVTVEEVRVG